MLLKVVTVVGTWDVDLTRTEKNETDIDLDNVEQEYVRFGSQLCVMKRQLVGYIDVEEASRALQQDRPPQPKQDNQRQTPSPEEDVQRHRGF